MALSKNDRTKAKAPYFGLTGGWLTFWVVRLIFESCLPSSMPSGVGGRVQEVWICALHLNHVAILQP